MIGASIGNYRIRRLLGAGGMGEVYLADHVAIGTRVAIKLLGLQVSQDSGHVQRFFNEARAVERVEHAGVVKIFDVGHHAGHAYLVMEYLDGETLGRRLRSAGAVTGAELLDITRQLAGTLKAVHDVGITHRDLKPDNVFLVRDRSVLTGKRVKLLDFGIAKLNGTLGGSSPRTHGTMGTPGYMAPEQWNDASSVDAKADVYSFGCVLFELVCGRPPFIAASVGEACSKHLHHAPPRARALTPAVPEELDALLDQMLAKSPAARPTMRAVAAVLDRIGEVEPAPRAPRADDHDGAATAPTEQSQPEAAAAPSTIPPPSLPPIETPPARPRRVRRAVMIGGSIAAAAVVAFVAFGRAGGADASARRVTKLGGEDQKIPIGEWQEFTAQVVDGRGVPVPNVRVAWRTPQLGELTYIDTTDEHGLSHATQLYSADTEMELEQTAAVAPDWQGSNWSKVAIATDAPVTFHYRQVRVHPQPLRGAARQSFETENPWVTAGGLSVTNHQISMREISLLAHVSTGSTPDAPAHDVTRAQAIEFCELLGARLMTSDEWTRLAAGAGKIELAGAAPSLADWTSSREGSRAVVRGLALTAEPPYTALVDPATSNESIGFRCVR